TPAPAALVGTAPHWADSGVVLRFPGGGAGLPGAHPVDPGAQTPSPPPPPVGPEPHEPGTAPTILGEGGGPSRARAPRPLGRVGRQRRKGQHHPGTGSRVHPRVGAGGPGSRPGRWARLGSGGTPRAARRA